jgi:Mn2+/Fe2+ NRAMP family transporter
VSSATLIPHIELSKAYLVLLVAVLGTTISPYLFFWQSAHRLEEMRHEPEGGTRAQPLRRQSPQRARRKQATSRSPVPFA